MAGLQHPFKAEIQLVRDIILNANPKICERVKWDPPSFYYGKYDFAAFNPRQQKFVHLVMVFPKGIMVYDDADLLQGDYKDRRMAYFTSADDVYAKENTLAQVVNDWIRLVDEV